MGGLGTRWNACTLEVGIRGETNAKTTHEITAATAEECQQPAVESKLVAG